MAVTKTVRPYGAWESVITTDMITQSYVRMFHAQVMLVCLAAWAGNHRIARSRDFDHELVQCAIHPQATSCQKM